MANYGKKSGAWKFWGWVILVLSIYIAGGLTLPPIIKNAKGWAIEKLSDSPKETTPQEEVKKEAPIPQSPKEEVKETEPVKDEAVKGETVKNEPVKKETPSKEEAPQAL